MNLHLNTRKLRLESLEERALLAVTAGGFELAAALPEPAAATAWIVNTLDDATSWDTADDILSLREAIGRAQTGDTITFDESLAGGTITLSGTELSIDKGITIDASSIGGMTIDADGKSRALYIYGGDETNPVELIGLTITGGQTNTNDYFSYGGGIRISGMLKITDCTIERNAAGGDYGYGGGIYNSGILAVTNSTVMGNTVNASSNGYGGGVYNSGTLTLTDSTIEGNATYHGGGIFNGGTVTIIDSAIIGNTANLEGGGVRNDSGTVTIINSAVTENVANNSGGGFFIGSGTVVIINAIITGNTANGRDYSNGGGIFNSGSLTVTNSTISGNIARNYGGIYNDGTLALANTIVSLNCANYQTDFYSSSSYSSIKNIIGFDPGFVVAPVFEDGKLVNADELDLSLTPESIAIDRGTNDVVETETDIAGNPRIAAAWREIATVDIGAYEHQGRVEQEDVPLTVVTTDLDIVDAADGLISLREAILYSAVTDEAVTFDASLAGKTIFLDGTQLEINTNVTIDATSIGGITIDAFDQSRVFYIGSGASVDLLGLTITGGWTEGDGGGIYVANSASLTLAGCTVTRNITTGGGGGIYVASNGTVTLTSSTVSENSATRSGGGIYNRDKSTVTLTDSTVSGNTASGNYGGGIYNYDGSTLTLTSTTVFENVAIYGGGGIYNAGGSTVKITDSAVSGNSTSGMVNNYGGGGIYNMSGTMTLTNSIVMGNTAECAGAGIANYDSLTISNSTVTGNAVIGDSDFYDYFNGYGGGIGNSGSLTLTNTIVSLNHANYDNDIYDSGHSLSGNNNIIGLDPGFVTAPVFENGILVNADELDLSLTAGSVAVDGGTNDAIESETDFAGNPRVFAAWRETATVDIGAFEYQGTVTRGDIEAPSTVVTTVLDVVDETDGLISLREAISYAVAGDTVTFDPSLASRTIILDGAGLVIDKNLSIDASALGGITIDGDARSRIFTLRNASGRVTVSLAALAIRNGRAYYGGGVYNDGVNLSLTNCTVTNSHAWNGGGICNTNSGTLTASNTTVSDNSVWNNYDYGTALYTSGGTVTFYNSIVTGTFSVSSTRVYAYNTLSDSFTNWTRSQNCPTYNTQLPLFADPSHGDYTLSENSQAINAGNNSYVTAETDLAGNPRILNGTVDLGAYEYTGLIEPLDAPSILTGSRGVFVSYGANRHQVTWSAVDRAAAYEFAYSLDGGSTWTSLETNDTAAVVRGLNYGTEVAYRVRALSARYLENSDWSAVKSFRVCPMDINGDGDISSGDRQLLSLSWLAEEGSETYRYYADINGDGDISGPDRNILSANWLCDADDPYLLYPRPVAAEIAFAEYASADPDIGFDLF